MDGPWVGVTIPRISMSYDAVIIHDSGVYILLAVLIMLLQKWCLKVNNIIFAEMISLLDISI